MESTEKTTSSLSQASQAYDELKRRIIRGVLAPGTRIVEREIARRLRVSRTPVREAVRRLAEEGFIIESRAAKYARFTVAALTGRDAREIHDIAAGLEAVAARRAAELPAELRYKVAREMRKRNTALARAAETRRPDIGRLVELDDSVHATYVEAVAGRRLLEMRRGVKPQIARYAWNYASGIVDQVPRSVAEHEAIITAIERGDGDAAEAAALTNWRNASERLNKVIELAGERGSW